MSSGTAKSRVAKLILARKEDEGDIDDKSVDTLDYIKDGTTRHAALTKKYQVSLDDTEDLSNLEDADLAALVDGRRRALAENESLDSKLPEESVVVESNIAARRAMSGLVTDLESLKQSLDCFACDLASIAGQTTDKSTAVKLNKMTKEFDSLCRMVKSAQAGLTNSRRNSESAFDGLTRILDSYKKSL